MLKQGLATRHRAENKNWVEVENQRQRQPQGWSTISPSSSRNFRNLRWVLNFPQDGIIGQASHSQNRKGRVIPVAPFCYNNNRTMEKMLRMSKRQNILITWRSQADFTRKQHFGVFMHAQESALCRRRAHLRAKAILGVQWFLDKQRNLRSLECGKHGR